MKIKIGKKRKHETGSWKSSSWIFIVRRGVPILNFCAEMISQTLVFLPSNQTMYKPSTHSYVRKAFTDVTPKLE